MTPETLRGLLAKAWKDTPVQLSPGRHSIDEVLLVRVKGEVLQREDQLATPTVSIPLIPTLAFLLQRMGKNRAKSLVTLAAAISDAMRSGTNVSECIEDETREVEAMIDGIRQGLLEQLPKQARRGACITKDLRTITLSGAFAEPFQGQAA